jgi:hypothetical protein
VAAPRWEERPLTRFERRGLAAGRPVTDLAYRRVPSTFWNGTRGEGDIHRFD